MQFPQDRTMRPNVKREHLHSIRDKMEDVSVSTGTDMRLNNIERLLKALTVYILQGGTNAAEEHGETEEMTNV